MERYEKKIVLEALCNFLENRTLVMQSINGLLSWMREHLEQVVSIPRPLLKALDDFADVAEDNDARYSKKEKNLHKARIAVLTEFEKAKQKYVRARPTKVAASIALIGDMFELTSLELQVLSCIVYGSTLKAYEDLFDAIKREHSRNSVIAALVGQPIEEVTRCLNGRGKLFTSGLLKGRGNIILSSMNYELNDRILDGVQEGSRNTKQLREAILGKTAQTELNWNDYDHLGETRDRLANFLSKAIDSKLPGVNILLYGPPGTGKTEFSKVLAKQIGVELFSVGEAGDEGGELDRKERMGHFSLACELLKIQKSTLLLFDEMDDMFDSSPLLSLFSNGRGKGSSKVFLNRMLQTNPVPTIWTINDPKILEDCVIRRMAFAVEMKAPPLNARSRLWERMLSKHQVELPEREVRELAAQESISPAIAETAIKFAKLTDGSLEDIRFVTSGLVKAMQGSQPLKWENKEQAQYHAGLVNADIDLKALVQGVTGSHVGKGFSLCLYGPPGTGKSAFGRYLAEQMGMEVLFYRASDLLDAYLGNSEKNIAGMFVRAQEEEKILILDEADSFLRNRQQALRSWEVTQVNELLTQMEDHPLPFVCTTNLMGSLDQASLRRFTFKTEFRYLTKDQQQSAFQHFFAVAPPESLRDYSKLTPGDFAVVKKKAAILNQLDQPETLVTYLAAEVAARQPVSKSIGFNQ